ncbi:Primosomal protein N' [Planctomycetes bacterium Pan216]|uniref:Replication restart protein PriA n=1 Tax=Kolteria novifilia TaxID=2527975 RepID=A0A518B5T9_9BACT|nr:Primosomal protein N' [Planctomycetes bacterium Pan216]
MARSQQRKLFDEAKLPPEDEDAGLYAQVVFNRPLRESFTYAIPVDMVGKILAGKRVLAPFGRGNNRTTGFCVGVSEEPPTTQKLKSIAAVLDEAPLLTPSMLRLTKWIADYYACGWGQVLDAVLPHAVKQRSGTRWTVFLQPVPEEKRPEAKLTAKQQRAFESLIDLKRPATIKELAQSARCGADCIKALVTKGWATSERRRVHSRPPVLAPIVWDRPRALNPHQKAAVDAIGGAIRDGIAKTFLLHGVTGSGKTEVYLQSIAEVVKLGRETIVLVPEISLTPQTIERFRQRFDEVAVLHSHLSDVDRHWHWQRIARGEVQVVIGARSALFAPCPNLGLIVIDEEHETTFKQETTPRYQARDVAAQRSRLENVPLILGSATPSLESWLAARQRRIELLSLPERVENLPMPRVTTVDMRHEYRSGARALSGVLRRAVIETVDAKGQVILFLNRRGFSTTILCPSCGHVESCEHCEISLTFHKKLDRLLCHFCDAEFPVPSRCSSCGLPSIRYAGIGTERLEEEVTALFPNYRCARMDSDTMRSAPHYDKVLTAFRRGEIDILLGTQMIAKGLDFPNVHLVGVVTADTGRNIPDFRASERTFQLIAQVAGRTGRGQTPGRVLVQTFNPDDPAILAATKHDYHRFVNEEMPTRKEFGYPPFDSLMRVIVRAKDEEVARHASKILAARFRACLSEFPPGAVRVLGPAPAPVAKLRDHYRMHFQVHSRQPALRQKLLEMAIKDLQLPGDTEFTADVDPISMM